MKSSAYLLALTALSIMSGCASITPPPVISIPRPPAELMTPPQELQPIRLYPQLRTTTPPAGQTPSN